MSQFLLQKEAYESAVESTDYPEYVKNHIKQLISCCSSPDELFHVTLLYLFNYKQSSVHVA